ncbi:hypothetical protein LXL04_022550 [Taraxacum kok-saghyz]
MEGISGDTLGGNQFPLIFGPSDRRFHQRLRLQSTRMDNMSNSGDSFSGDAGISGDLLGGKFSSGVLTNVRSILIDQRLWCSGIESLGSGYSARVVVEWENRRNASQEPCRNTALVISGGHNGLTAAAYLAQSGLSVAVLERRHLIGGAAITEELIPGFKFSRCSYLQSLLRPSIIRDLELHRHGLKLMKRSPSSFTPCLDGRYLLLGPNAELNIQRF